MREMFAVAAAIIGIGAVVASAAYPNQRPNANKPNPPIASPLSGSTSSDLARRRPVSIPKLSGFHLIQATRCRSSRHRARRVATNRSNQSSHIRCRDGSLAASTDTGPMMG